jgi:hypothetical protein
MEKNSQSDFPTPGNLNISSECTALSLDSETIALQSVDVPGTQRGAE